MKTRTVLFVDDDKEYLGLVEGLVVTTGITAYFATSGKEAVELLEKGFFTTMVTDLNMPGMDGYELALIARELCPGIEIIMVTGDISPDVMELAAKTGVSVVLAKPVHADQILEIALGRTARPAAPTVNACWTGS